MNTEYVVWSYVAYLTISISLTIWVAWTLHRNGQVFLIEAFNGDEKIASSVNHLLVVGFYLINIGYVALALKYGDKPFNTAEAFEFCSTKTGLVMLVLGTMHFLNLYLFAKVRRRALLHRDPPPVTPDDHIALPNAS